jgi:hypothetical protein
MRYTRQVGPVKFLGVHRPGSVLGGNEYLDHLKLKRWWDSRKKGTRTPEKDDFCFLPLLGGV